MVARTRGESRVWGTSFCQVLERTEALLSNLEDSAGNNCELVAHRLSRKAKLELTSGDARVKGVKHLGLVLKMLIAHFKSH